MKHLANFNVTWQKHPSWLGLKFVQIKGPAPVERGDNYEKAYNPCTELN